MARSQHEVIRAAVPRWLDREVQQHGARMVRFGLVGLSGVVVTYVVLYLLVDGIGMRLLLATALATEAAILSNFTLNNLWTFRNVRTDASLAGRLLRYNLFALGGLGISVVVMALLAHQLGMHYLIANLFAIGSAALWNYAMNARWTWCARDPATLTAGERR